MSAVNNKSKAIAAGLILVALLGIAVYMWAAGGGSTADTATLDNAAGIVEDVTRADPDAATPPAPQPEDPKPGKLRN